MGEGTALTFVEPSTSEGAARTQATPRARVVTREVEARVGDHGPEGGLALGWRMVVVPLTSGPLVVVRALAWS